MASRVVDLTKLIKDLNNLDANATKNLAIAINETSEDITRKSIDEIADRVELQKSYISKHLFVEQKATTTNPQAIITGNARGTLLTQYPFEAFEKTENNRGGVRVKVNKNGSSHDIQGAFKIRLKAGASRGNSQGIALRNKDALEYFERNLSKGARTTAKQDKLNKIRRKAASKPRGITVLHSRSINQLFDSIREEQTDENISNLADEIFNRLFR